jgi:release factor glutamine methyltransferase
VAATEDPSAWTLGSLRRFGAKLLRETQRIEPREATHLLSHLLGLSEAQVLARDALPVTPPTTATFLAQLTRRLRGEPFAYIVGSREFFGRDFRVDRRALIPRPETEHLIESILDLDLPSAANCLDVGTGSGCIALTLALERPDWRLFATDRSLDALQVAAANRRAFGLEQRLQLLFGDLLAGLRAECFDLLAANPPYVDSSSRATLQPEVHDHEPALALFATEEGLSVYRRLLRAAESARPGAYLALELGAGQLGAVVDLARGSFAVHGVRTDYAGIDRILVLQRA